MDDAWKGRHREYCLWTTDAGKRAWYRLAILRQVEQGNGEAQEAARDLIDDLQPSLLLVVGIATYNVGGGPIAKSIATGSPTSAPADYPFRLDRPTC